MAIYMKPAGICGSVSSGNHQNWIELKQAFFGGVSLQTLSQVGQKSGRINGNPHFGDVEIVKTSDKSSAALLAAACEGKAISQVEIHLVTDGNPPFTCEKYLFKDVIINHLDKHYMNGCEPEENMSLNYATVEYTFVPRGKDNMPLSPITTGFDLAQARKL